jgi:GNAT superfamily N-acetyltransferase
MPAFHLPTVNHVPASIEGESEQLSAFLAPMNDPVMVARMGEETVVRNEGALLVVKGERYTTREGWVQGMRYLQLGLAGTPIAALNVTRTKQGGKTSTIASNVYVAPTHRRQGLASDLLAQAKADYPNLRADTSMSQAGAALTGHATVTPTRRPSGP